VVVCGVVLVVSCVVFFFLLYISHIIQLIPQQQSAEPRNSADVEALAVARRPKEASREKTLVVCLCVTCFSSYTLQGCGGLTPERARAHLPCSHPAGIAQDVQLDSQLLYSLLLVLSSCVCVCVSSSLSLVCL